MISGPASQQNSANPWSALHQFPPQAHLAGGSTTTGSAGASGQPSGSNQQTDQLATNNGSPNSAVTQQVAATRQWLELCIRSGPDTFVLGEIDITRIKMDHWVFYAIKQKYELNRVAARLFGRFAYRIPNGGVSVKVSVRRSSRPTNCLQCHELQATFILSTIFISAVNSNLILELSSGKTNSQLPTVTRPRSASWLAHACPGLTRPVATTTSSTQPPWTYHR